LQTNAILTPILLLVATIFITCLSVVNSTFFTVLNLYFSCIYLIPYVYFLVGVYPRARHFVQAITHKEEPTPEEKDELLLSESTLLIHPEEVHFTRALQTFDTFYKWFIRVLCIGLPALLVLLMFCGILLSKEGSVGSSLGIGIFTGFFICLVAVIVVYLFEGFPTRYCAVENFIILLQRTDASCFFWQNFCYFLFGAQCNEHFPLRRPAALC